MVSQNTMAQWSHPLWLLLKLLSTIIVTYSDIVGKVMFIVSVIPFTHFILC